MTRDTTDIWNQLHTRLRAYIRRRVRTDADADDVLQEVFLRIHANLHRLEDEQRLLPWIHRIASNAVTDHYRARERSDSTAAALGRLGGVEAIDGDPGDEDAVPGADLVCCLEPLLDELPEQQAEAMRLADLEGLPRSSVASQLGVSLTAARSRVQRGRERVRELLERCCRIEMDRRGNVIDYERRGREGTCC